MESEIFDYSEILQRKMFTFFKEDPRTFKFSSYSVEHSERDVEGSRGSKASINLRKNLSLLELLEWQDKKTLEK